MKFTPNLTKTEWKNGLIAMTVAMFLLPGLIAYIPGLSGARLNFAAHFISAGTAVYCLRRFLGKNITAALDRPFATLYLAVLGYLSHLVFAELADFIAWTLLPGYVNLNTQAVQTQLSADLPLMLATTVVLAPIGEECFFRGLLFRGIYDRSPLWAWVLSRLGLKEKLAPWGGDSLAAPTPTAKSLPALVSSDWPSTASGSCIPVASTSVIAHRTQTALSLVSLGIRFLFLLG